MQEGNRVSATDIHIAHLRIENTNPPARVQIEGTHRD
jgi:hypothetical protein